MKRFIKNTIAIYKKCSVSRSSFLRVYLKYLYYKAVYKKDIIAHQYTKINNVKNIALNGRLNVGVQYVGFVPDSERTLLNVAGKLEFKKGYSIGRGCRFDIGKDAVASFGKGGYVNVNSKFIIMHKLTIGDNCAIAWDCEFLDEDFHKISYEGKKERDKEIVIGNKVWIGAGAKIYQGTKIADGCVVASNSVVRGCFEEENVIIGGNPARIIKRNINWN